LQANPRPIDPSDYIPIVHLFRDASRRFQGFSTAELNAMLEHEHGMVLEAGNEIWGAALCSWRVADTTWLRGVALADGLDVRQALNALLLPLHAFLRSDGITKLFYAGDEGTDIWMQPTLQARGYLVDTDVIVFEKRDYAIPSKGNSKVVVRPALPLDTEAVSALDRICFDAQWVKDERILAPAILQGPLFLVAELGSRIVGYAYATSHFSGRLIHLTRIAVDPHYRGDAIGVRLLAEVIEYARSQRADAITLNTQSHNLRAQRLYEWFGFQQTGERQIILRFDL